MSDMDNGDNCSVSTSGQWLTKVEMIEKLAKEGDNSGAKLLIISDPGDEPADPAQVAKSMDISPDSNAFSMLKTFCDAKKSTEIQARSFAQRIAPLGDEHFTFLKTLCENSLFTAQSILDLIASLKKFSGKRLLLLHGFTELKEADPGHLSRFFIATTSQLDKSQASHEAVEHEMQEKAMTSSQIDVFYNICLKLPDIDADTALAVLPKLRKLKGQHTRVLNLFISKESCFDGKPINAIILPGLINLWASLPEISSQSHFEKLVKKLSHQSDEKKHDFKFITQVYKNEAEKEGEPPSKIASAFKHLIH